MPQSEAVTVGVMEKNVVFKNFANFAEKHLCCSLFLIKLVAGSCRRECLQRCWEETPTQMFSFGICETFKSSYFEEHLRTTASAQSNMWNCCFSEIDTQNVVTGKQLFIDLLQNNWVWVWLWVEWGIAQWLTSDEWSILLSDPKLALRQPSNW